MGTNGPDERSAELTGKLLLSRNFRVEKGDIRIAARNNVPADFVVSFAEKFVPAKIVPKKRAAFSTQTPLCDLLKNPEAWEILVRNVPDLQAEIEDSVLRTMPVPFADILAYSGKKLEEDVVRSLDAELEKLG